MAAVNKQMNPMKVAQTMKDFEQASAHMDMSEEMSKSKFCQFLLIAALLTLIIFS